MNETNVARPEATCQSLFIDADDFLIGAIDRITEGRFISPAVCDFLIDLLQGARVPLQRLGSLE